jgi:hypothetical protein
MRRLRWLYWRLAWGVLLVVSLSGCDALKGMGDSLGDVMKKIKLP